MKKFIGFALVCVCVMVSCHRVKPQSPSQRTSDETTTKEDSVQFATQQFNQRMAQAADDQLAAYVRNSNGDEEYALHDFGLWFSLVKETEGEPYERQQKAAVHVVVTTLDDKPLLDIIQTITVGKSEIARCVDFALFEMRRGEQARLLAPWYIAFGITGDLNVPPYENVKIDLYSLD
ncbi:MAG: hypothetical protein IJS05_04380 [Paludibacteraceae bacterium]|nr:hypothetical protein [Paludibacteraceae bacterium]